MLEAQADEFGGAASVGEDEGRAGFAEEAGELAHDAGGGVAGGRIGAAFERGEDLDAGRFTLGDFDDAGGARGADEE